MFYFFGNNLRTHCLKDAEQVESPDTRGGSLFFVFTGMKRIYHKNSCCKKKIKINSRCCCSCGCRIFKNSKNRRSQPKMPAETELGSRLIHSRSWLGLITAESRFVHSDTFRNVSALHQQLLFQITASFSPTRKNLL